MLICLTRIINRFEFELVNIDTFIIRVGFKLTNIDMIHTLTRYEHDPLIRIVIPIFEYIGLFFKIKN